MSHSLDCLPKFEHCKTRSQDETVGKGHAGACTIILTTSNDLLAEFGFANPRRKQKIFLDKGIVIG